MNKFYIITNAGKDKTLETTRRIQKFIESKGKECVLNVEGNASPEGADCILVLGGDGTLIRAAREYHSYGIPMLGINMGTLGYLAEVEVHHIEDALEQLMEGNSVIESRMMLKGTLNGNGEDLALNDIVISRLGALRIIRFKIYVNGELLNSYQADGAIVSTPTGSTGYNLSAGGPIVEPTAKMIVITPICSHALNTSSIVLSADDEIMIEIGKARDGSVEEVGISFDGDRNLVVHTGDRLVIKRADDTTQLVKLSRDSFLETLRKKMKGN